MSLSVRNLRLLVMGTWSAFLLWLWLSDNVLRYLGPHTVWVVKFGGVALGLATIAYAWVSQGGADERTGVSRSQVAGLLAVLLPVAIGFMMTNVSLGALAASNKLTSRGVDMAELAQSLASDSDQVSFLQIAAVSDDESLSDEYGISDGTLVSLTGLVMKPSTTPRGRFDFGRFYITCCIADAVPVSVTVDANKAGGGPYRADQWLAVVGYLQSGKDGYRLEASKITPVAQPSDPYLSFK
ncbi:MAG: TIGR03943 family protein [Solirubrobacterales bacterium]|nr:TIGR03943 family protein [Solirubrobacterales bacterium]OJU93509.1 MAG: TIGR03943 family protein [Solirubrobacterales bacterium 67-14]